MSVRETLFSPVIQNNPIALQILGICSALAVTSSLQVSLVMSVALTAVTALSRVRVPTHPRDGLWTVCAGCVRECG